MTAKNKSNELVKKQAAGKGHNSDELKRDYVKKLVGLKMEMTAIRGREKDLLNNAKTDGILKTSLRNAVKELAKTDEQLQAQKEVDTETAYITALCKGLPLFEAAA